MGIIDSFLFSQAFPLILIVLEIASCIAALFLYRLRPIKAAPIPLLLCGAVLAVVGLRIITAPSNSLEANSITGTITEFAQRISYLLFFPLGVFSGVSLYVRTRHSAARIFAHSSLALLMILGGLTVFFSFSQVLPLTAIALICIQYLTMQFGNNSSRFAAALTSLAFLTICLSGIQPFSALGGKYGEISDGSILLFTLSAAATSILLLHSSLKGKTRANLASTILCAVITTAFFPSARSDVSCSCSVGCEFGQCDVNLLLCQQKADVMAPLHGVKGARARCSGYYRDFIRERDARSLAANDVFLRKLPSHAQVEDQTH